MMRRITALAARLASLARGGGPLARRRERTARAAIGMPARHPERITRGLRRRHEEWLTGLAARLWPGDEYAEIVRDCRPDGSGGEGR